ncbi:CD225/dispanin family protein [Amycolatopsis sp. NBC_01488]|uniref:CD225/dispanin family protein n=1 Tax=Amycolatopsis sp. NBC_01488 TaxID=2903563 RepID=UPI002E2CD06B|nr:CD225/dispanin family protein [Amycolatopsis sp. NBC_01488]
MTQQYPHYGWQPNYGPPPDSNLVWGILTTVLCCLPLGIVSIVKASQVNTLWFQGFHAEAHRAADEARKWAMWSAISAGVLIALYLAFILVMLALVGVSFRSLVP